jgi:hypothetical protein
MNKPATIPASVRLLAARVRYGRPRVLTGRVLTSLLLAGIVLHSGAGPAPVAGVLTGIVTWLALTVRGHLAPPPGR